MSALISTLVVLAFTDWGVLAYVLTGPQLHPHPAYYGYVYPVAQRWRETGAICWIPARRITLDAIHT